MVNIFVSHAWDDKVKNQFGQVCREFRDFNLWLDTKGLVPGGMIRPELKKAIEDTDVVLVLWSHNAARSKDMLFEIETAQKANKAILPCIIDDCPLQQCEYLSGRLYFDLRETGDAVEMLGWMKLKQYILQVNYQKLAAVNSNASPERQHKLRELEQMQQSVQQQISLLETTAHRIRMKAENRDRKNPYMLNMIDTLISALDKPHASAEDKQTIAFLSYAGELFAQYPHDDIESKHSREALMFEKITTLDPGLQNQQLLLFKNALDNGQPGTPQEQQAGFVVEDEDIVAMELRAITAALGKGDATIEQLKQWQQWCSEQAPQKNEMVHKFTNFISNEIDRLQAGGTPVSKVDYQLMDEAIRKLDQVINEKKAAANEYLTSRIRKYGGFLLHQKVIQTIVSANLKYLTDSPVLLQQLANEAKVSEFVAVKEATNKVVEYLALKSGTDENGNSGLEAYLDVAYLIHHTAHLLIKSNLVPHDSFRLDFVSMNIVDKYVTFLLGRKTKARLDEILQEIRTMTGVKKLEINWGQVAAIVISAAAIGNKLYSLSNQKAMTPPPQSIPPTYRSNMPKQDDVPDPVESSLYVEDRIAALSAKYGLGLNIYNT